MARIRRLDESFDPHVVEAEAKKYWEENRIYSRLKDKLRNGPKFYFLDGPPYVSSKTMHPGTAWNKIIKDAVIRYWRMNGYNVWDKPGYDCHGLPIEVQIEKNLGVKNKREIEERIGVERFVLACKRFAEENAEALTRLFSDLGVFMDWNNPYMTLRNEYVEEGWWLIKKAYEKGLLTQDVKVVHWCPRCETTLADYEVSEYRELEDPSIYVKFKVKNTRDEYLLVWTTTPWTLPANVFVMANPTLTYVKVRVKDETLILAEQRLRKVMEEAGISNYKIIARFKGTELSGIEYKHPLEGIVPIQEEAKPYHRVVLSEEFVTAHEGTGLVHAAPGHGEEDFIVGSRIKAPVLSPVDDQGRFTEEAGPYKGLPVREANSVIIKDLERIGALFHSSVIRHKYPVCWRCKTPLIMRATKQWIIRVTPLKTRLKEEADKIHWIPSWAHERFMHMIENLRDWVISRQRYWGTPLPIWMCEKCGHIEVIGSRKELLEKGARNVPEELHRPWIDKVTLKCPKCGGTMHRVPDVADVWFDSGISFYASIGRKKWEEFKPVDFIVEGHDQTRGWFFSLLRTGVLGFDEAPYSTVLVHGFMLDKQGREMHKSLGNYVPLEEILVKAGRDAFRLWLLQNVVWEDLRFNWEALNQSIKDLGVVWNVFVFASTYMSLDKYDPVEKPLSKYMDALEEEDRWILSRLNTVLKEANTAFQNYRMHEAARTLRSFILGDVSRWYIRLIRRRVWVEEESISKDAAYATLYHVLKNWLVASSPIIPHLAEKLYVSLFMPAEPGSPPSVHMLEYPKHNEDLIDTEVENAMKYAREIVEASASARMRAGVKLRQPVRELIVASNNPSVLEAARMMQHVILDQANAKNLRTLSIQELRGLQHYVVEPVYKEIGPQFKGLSKRIIRYMEENSDKVARDIIDKGFHKARIDGEDVKLEARHVKITAVYEKGVSASKTPWGVVAVDTRLTEEELAEGLARDIVRRIQFMRKEMNLDINDNIRTLIIAPPHRVEPIKRWLAYIASETRSFEINVSSTGSMDKAYKKAWDINGEEYIIYVAKA